MFGQVGSSEKWSAVHHFRGCLFAGAM